MRSSCQHFTKDECSSYCDLIGCIQQQRTSKLHVMQRLVNDWLKFANDRVASYLVISSFVHICLFVAVFMSVWQALYIPHANDADTMSLSYLHRNVL